MTKPGTLLGLRNEGTRVYLTYFAGNVAKAVDQCFEWEELKSIKSCMRRNIPNCKTAASPCHEVLPAYGCEP